MLVFTKQKLINVIYFEIFTFKTSGRKIQKFRKNQIFNELSKINDMKFGVRVCINKLFLYSKF